MKHEANGYIGFMVSSILAITASMTLNDWAAIAAIFAGVMAGLVSLRTLIIKKKKD